MQVSKTNQDGLTQSFAVVLSAREIEAKVDEKLIELRDQVQLKGFRPGKVPMGHLKRTFGRSVLGEVVEKTVTEASRQVVKDNAIIAAAEPKLEITRFEEGGDLEFSMKVDSMPPIPPIEARSIKLERLIVDVTDAEVDQAVARMAKSSREAAPRPDGEAAQAGDAVVIDFAGTVDGVAFDGGTAKGHELELGSGQFIPGFEDQLIGVKKGDTRDVNVTFPENYGASDLAGKAAVFAVTVHEVKSYSDPVIDDEFAKKFGMETVEALREAARAQLGQEYKNRSRMHLKRALLDALDKQYTFELPPSLVEAEFNQILAQIQPEIDAEAKARGQAAPEIDEAEKAEFHRIAARRVRLGLLLAEVGRVNNIQVAQEDLNRAVVDQARRYPGQERQVFEYYNKNPEATAELRAPLFEEKVVDFIIELAAVTERSVTREELYSDPEIAEESAS